MPIQLHAPGIAVTAFGLPPVPLGHHGNPVAIPLLHNSSGVQHVNNAVNYAVGGAVAPSQVSVTDDDAAGASAITSSDVAGGESPRAVPSSVV